MTPREQLTLKIIMNHVGHYNDKAVAAAHWQQLRMTNGRQTFAVYGGDYIIGKVEFRPTGAQCA